MTGRDLIMYILQNHLEDEPVFKDGEFMGFMTLERAAASIGVGTATINTLIKRGVIQGVYLDSAVLVPVNFKSKIEE